MRKRLVGLAAFAGAAVGGAALGYLAERRTVHPVTEVDDAATFVAVRGTPVEVESADRTRLHAEVSGPEGAPTVVFAHGMGLSSATWHHQRRALADEFRIVAYDHRGHGGSQQADDYSLEALGHDLAAVVEQCAPDGPVILVGHSMGGMAIVSLSQLHPGLVRRRVAGAALCNTAMTKVLAAATASSAAAALSVVQARLAGSRLVGAALLRSSDPDARPSTDLSLALTRYLGMTGDAAPEVVSFLERELRSCPPIVLAGYAPELASVDLLDAAAAFEPPALVLLGQRDRVTPPRQGRRLAEVMPRAELLELPDVGHTAMLEDPERVSEALRTFAGGVLRRKVA